jgi:hypothetical protein
VDSRLFYIEGTRPSRIRKQDVPTLVVALIGVIRARAQMVAGRIRGIDCVRITSPGLRLAILKEDWLKIQPLVEDGTLNPVLSPKGQPAAYLHPETSYDESCVDLADRALYIHLMGILEPLFPDKWPTSNL